MTSMPLKPKAYQVDFMTIEQTDDLIVSFAVASGGSPGDVLSLTLLRTPKYEFILDPEERGISVSWEQDEDENELLVAADITRDAVKLDTNRREFVLDVSRVSDGDLRRMRQVLRRMNSDGAIMLTGV